MTTSLNQAENSNKSDQPDQLKSATLSERFEELAKRNGKLTQETYEMLRDEGRDRAMERFMSFSAGKTLD